MKTSIDHEANALYVTLTDSSIAQTVQLSTSILVDVDENGAPVGIEVLQPASIWLDTVLDRFENRIDNNDVQLLKAIYPARQLHMTQLASTQRTRDANLEITSETLQFA